MFIPQFGQLNFHLLDFLLGNHKHCILITALDVRPLVRLGHRYEIVSFVLYAEHTLAGSTLEFLASTIDF